MGSSRSFSKLGQSAAILAKGATVFATAIMSASCASTYLSSGFGGSSEFGQSGRFPAARIPTVGTKSLLKSLFSDPAIEGKLGKWILKCDGAHSAGQAAELGARLRLELSSTSREELLQDARLRSILSKDLESLADQDLAFLKAWSAARAGARLGGSGVTAASAAASRTAGFKRIVERTLFAATDRHPRARASAVAFLKDMEPLLVSGEVEPELLSAIVRRVQWSRLGEEETIDSLSALRAMLAYHRSELDPAAAARVLEDVSSLKEVREAYLSAMLIDVPDPRMIALVGKGSASEALVAEREFAASRDKILAEVDRLRWFTKNPVKAVDLQAQKSLTELDYLIRIGDRKAARALASRKFLAVETAALYVQKYRELIAEAVVRSAPAAEINDLKRTLVAEERILGAYFEEYRVFRAHLEGMMNRTVGACDAGCAAFARDLDENIGLTDLKKLTFKVSFEGMSRPSLARVQEIFFSSAVAQMADLRNMLHTEAFHTLKSVASSVLLLEEIQKIAARIPALGKRFDWTKKVLFMLYDGRARHVHFPEISRIMRAQGGIKEQLDMLEQMALPPNEDLMVTFARRLEDPVRDFWKQLKAEARVQAGDLAPSAGTASDSTFEGLIKRIEGGERVSLIERMEAAEKQATSLGGISFYFDQSPAVKVGVLAVAGSYGAYAWLSDDSPDRKKAEKIAKEASDTKEKIDKHASEAEKRRIQEGIERSRRARQQPSPNPEPKPDLDADRRQSEQEDQRAREIERAREAARRAARGGN